MRSPASHFLVPGLSLLVGRYAFCVFEKKEVLGSVADLNELGNKSRFLCGTVNGERERRHNTAKTGSRGAAISSWVGITRVLLGNHF